MYKTSYPYVKQRYILPYDSCAGSVDMQKEAIFKYINRNVNSSIRKKSNRLSLSLKNSIKNIDLNLFIHYTSY